MEKLRQLWVCDPIWLASVLTPCESWTLRSLSATKSVFFVSLKKWHQQCCVTFCLFPSITCKNHQAGHWCWLVLACNAKKNNDGGIHLACFRFNEHESVLQNFNGNFFCFFICLHHRWQQINFPFTRFAAKLFKAESFNDSEMLNYCHSVYFRNAAGWLPVDLPGLHVDQWPLSGSAGAISFL